ncbi:MAG: alpha/beta hydrolase family protein [Vulcanimicrobiaceae bacterium]
MRPLEILVVAAGLLAIVPLAIVPTALGRRGRLATALALLVLTGMQIVLTGARREMLPAYLAVLTLVASVWWTAGARAWLRYGFALLGCILLGGALAASIALPVFGLPEPTGPDAIGTVVLRGPGLQVWYPARAGSSGVHASYTLARPPARSLGARFDRARLVRTPAIVGAPVVAGAHPLILYVPGWDGTRADNTTQALELASHGFIVAGMDDRYPGHSLDFSSQAASASTQRWANRKVMLQAAVARGALDALLQLDAHDPERRFTGSIDRSRVGIFGFSFGGAVAAETASLDPRLRAAANLDGWLFGQAAENGVPRPFFVMSTPLASDDIPADPALHYYALFDKANDRKTFRGLRRQGGYFLIIDGTDHANFVDWALYSPQKWRAGAGGSIDSLRSERIVSAYLLEFFERVLNGAPAPLLEAKSENAGANDPKAIGDPAAHLQIWLRKAGTTPSRRSLPQGARTALTR